MARNTKRIIFSMLGIFAIGACTSIDPVYLNDADSVITQMELRASETAIAKGYDVTLNVVGTFEDGSTADITDRVSWTSSNPDVLAIQGRGRSAKAQGLAEGGATLVATLVPEDPEARATWTAEINVIVGPPVCQTIEITPGTVDIKVGQTSQLAAMGTFSDGSSRDVTAEVTWASANPEFLSVDAKGLVTATGQGSANITAALGVAEASIQGTGVCGYPGESTSITMGGLFPGLSWAGAYTPDGDVKLLDLEEFHCSDRYKDYTTINFIVGTGWCPNCPGYMRELENISAELEAAGGLLVYVEIQNNDRSPSDSNDANTIVNRYIQSAVGWRIGDTDSTPRSGVFGAAIRSIPDAFVVRKSDMKVIGHLREANRNPDFIGMASDPESF